MAGTKDTTLKVIQGGNLRRRFRRRVNGVYQPMTGVIARSQIRDKVGGVLLLNLTPYFTIDPLDATTLQLSVPGTATSALKTDGVWDIFFDGQYITGGCVDLTRSVTQL